MSLNNIPVSKYNTFPSATKAWQRIAWFAATYGGELEDSFYQALLSYTKPAAEKIAAMQAAGVQFGYKQCRHWAIELCGSFEVTHPQYKPPVGYRLPQATYLYGVLASMFGR